MFPKSTPTEPPAIEPEIPTNNPDENQISTEVEDTGPVALPVDLVGKDLSRFITVPSKHLNSFKLKSANSSQTGLERNSLALKFKLLKQLQYC